jgi:hypothetical protein
MRSPAGRHRFPIGEGRFCPATRIPERIMLDIVFVALGLGWLALCVGYAALCERL